MTIFAFPPKKGESPDQEIDRWHKFMGGRYKGTTFGNSVENGIRAKHRGEPHWADKLVGKSQVTTKDGIRKWADDQGEG